MTKITVKDTEDNVVKVNGEDYICLTDMMRAKDGDFFITTGFAAGTPGSLSESGRKSIIQILIMANSPQLEIKQVLIVSR